MIGPFIKKDFLVVLRNRQELLVLLVMPFLLIVILSFALKDFMEGDLTVIQANVAFIEHGSEEEELETFLSMVKSENISAEIKHSIIEGAKGMLPVNLLKNEVLGHEELREIIHLEQIEPEMADEVKQEGGFEVVIEIPENFTLHFLQNMFLKGEQEAKIQLYKNDSAQISSGIVEDVIQSFQKELSARAVLMAEGIPQEVMDFGEIGTLETVPERELIRSSDYYTVGMSVMFVLFVASYVASYAYQEKETHVFNRILLSNVSPWSYFSGIFISSMAIAFLQQMILYGSSALIFQVYWHNLLAFFIINSVLCFSVGGLASLLTVINFRINSETVSNFFGTAIVAFFSFLGGSFTPIGDTSSFIGKMGNLTPNGSAMTSLLKVKQGAELGEITEHLVYLFLFGVVLLGIAVIAFPRREART